MKTNSLISIFVISFLLVAWIPSSAQQNNETFFTPSRERSGPGFGMQLGSSFSTGFGSGNMFSQSIAPHFQWNPGQRWSVTVGSVLTSAQTSGMNGFYSLNSQGTGQVMPDRLFSTTVYAMGAYQLNPRLTLTGGTWLDRSNMPQPANMQMNPQAFNMDGRGMMLGFDYRITENFRFGAEVRMSSGYNPFNPLSGPGAFNQGASPFRPVGW